MAIQHLYLEIKGSDDKLMASDIHFNDEVRRMPIVIFAHGYKGFKDFGAWNLIGDQMAQNGIVFVRFNFSHNGTTIKNPSEFGDLDAFGQNNYSKEVADLSTIIDHIHNLAVKTNGWDEENICIIGHSRGGGIAILAAKENKYVSSLITWAAIKSMSRGMPTGELLEKWKEDGVRYVLNGRTKQQMPHYYQFFKDFIANRSRLSIENAARSIQFPWMIIHGDNDEAVALDDARQLHNYNPSSTLKVIKNGSHTFSISHPWDQSDLPKEMQQVVDLSITFIKKESI